MKIYILFAVLAFIPLSTAYALNPKNKKTITINVNGEDIKTTEKALYQKMYDLEYNAAMSYWTDIFENDIGMTAAYFIDDIKAYAKCEAEIFTSEMTIDDYKTLTTEYYSDETKNAIRAGLMIKAKPCISKHFPYLDNKESTVQTYVKRKCGDADTLTSEARKEEWYYCTAKILKQFDMCPEEICPKGAN